MSQHPRPLRRLNWVERKWDNEKLSARIDGVKDMAKVQCAAIYYLALFKLLRFVKIVKTNLPIGLKAGTQ
jgi:hypothetical protein